MPGRFTLAAFNVRFVNKKAEKKNWTFGLRTFLQRECSPWPSFQLSKRKSSQSYFQQFLADLYLKVSQSETTCGMRAFGPFWRDRFSKAIAYTTFVYFFRLNGAQTHLFWLIFALLQNLGQKCVWDESRTIFQKWTFWGPGWSSPGAHLGR